MKDLQYYTSRPKADKHNHLNLGMHYNTYKQWSGITIPNFPRKLNGLDDMHDIIAKYTRPRSKTSEDVIKLIDMSITDAIADNIVILEGSIDIGFMIHFEENLDKFIEMAQSFVTTYAGKIEFRPELGMGKTFNKEKIDEWAPELMKSGVFKSIDLYGPEVEDGIEGFKYLYTLAEKLGIKKKAHVGEFSDAKSVRDFVEFFDLEEVQHGIGAAQDEKIMQFLADRKVQCNVCPQSNVVLGAVSSLKEHPIKKMMDAGIPVTVATDDLLFFDHTVGQQICNLVTEGVISEDDAEKLLGDSIKN
ncbi:adenosine deaminase [Brucepastera parasyntrophica]|uniref:adenosine deaminase n=1 Tax=Brucepastera parasyntrophica TaxID=2880008 RepID=UPI00210D3E88|nr:adenosine deaminase [Brucepastera parasyntrophica]ULQ61071.1 adenosine deaminase [Brucepastera parasyntrophica]